MFRKPKRTAKGNFRSSTTSTSTSTININIANTTNNDDDSDNDNNGTFPNNNPMRQQQQQQKSLEENSDDSDNNNTNTNNNNFRLLQNAKKRTKLMGSKTITTALTNQNNNDTSDITKRINDESNTSTSSTAMAMTQKDLVTSIADYHPESLLATKTTTTTTTSGNTNNTIDGIGNDGIYRNKQRNKFLAGPIRASGNVRVTTRFDYQPDICKDYKDTGFCGYGDTCIYLHDRSDTLSGWQIELQWQQQQDLLKKQQNDEMLNFAQQHISSNNDGTSTNSTDNNNSKLENKIDDDGIPFACYICRDYFKDPVVTKCGHYFCEKCILQSVQGSDNNSNCPICLVDTGSIFNEPTKLISKMRKVIGITQSKQQQSAWKLYFNRYNNNNNTTK